MAKKSSIEKNAQREKLAKSTAARRRRLKAVAIDRDAPPDERFAERSGGAVTLAAMEVPTERYEDVAAMVNARDEVAHNYERTHKLNMWYVLAVENPEEIVLFHHRFLVDYATELNFRFMLGLRLGMNYQLFFFLVLLTLH